MSDFTRDWDNTSPANHTLINTSPAEDRKIKVDVEDRLSGIVSGFSSGESVKGILGLPFKAVSKPSVVADQIQLYAKDVAGKTELFTLTEDNSENQVTNGGKFAMSAAEILAAVGPLMMPVGYVVTLGVSTNPATLFGFGTWTAIAGKVIVGLDAGQTEFDVLDETGGEKTHTLTTTEMPAHTHSYTYTALSGRYDGSSSLVATNSTSGTTGSTGGDGAHNNLQPYIVKYVWQRTA